MRYTNVIVDHGLLLHTDLTITTDRLTELFKSVENLTDVCNGGFGGWLQLPPSATSEIEMNFQDDTRRTEAYLETYTHQHPCPSWQQVSQALRFRNLIQQAADVENTYVEGKRLHW